MQKITPCLWFDSNAEEAVKFYASTFGAKIGTITRYDTASAEVSGRPKGSVLTVAFQINGQEFIALNGGPLFKFTPAISFFVTCKTKQEVDTLWKKLSPGGEVRMELNTYPWSERYGWIKDKFGVDWQLMLCKAKQKITPCLLFVGKQFGKAESAIKLYTSVFKGKTIAIDKYSKKEGFEGAIKHVRIELDGYEFALMDGPGDHAFTFSEATSFVVNCKTQDEVDYFWEKLSKGGEKSQCGWLKDKFGVSWQIVPTVLDELLGGKDKKRAERAMQAMLKMTKLDIKKLKEAYKG